MTRNLFVCALGLFIVLILYLAIPGNDEHLPDTGTVEDRGGNASRSFQEALSGTTQRSFMDQAYLDARRNAHRPRLDPSPSDAEKKRLHNWKTRFPFPPTTDPELQYSHEDYKSDKPMYSGIMADHERLKRFYADDLRYSREFEIMYSILAESGRTNNVMPMIQMFWNLWKYHDNIDTDEKYAMRHKEGVYGVLLSRQWMNPYYRTEEGEAEARIIQERLVDETDGLVDLPEPWPMTAEERAHGKSYAQSFTDGDAENIGDILVPYVGYAEEFARYQENRYSTSLANQIRKVLEPPEMPPNTRVSSVKYYVRLPDGTRMEVDKDEYVNWVMNVVIPTIDEANAETQEVEESTP